jgi:hypothetical protein
LDPYLTELLELPDERPHVHGFHPYPARFPPSLVAGLLSELQPGAVVLDPFAGSGTTIVEARLHGFQAWANDLNPVAVLLCAVKGESLPPKALNALQSDLQYLRKYIHGRLASRDEEQHVKLPKGERMFHPHVYWEMQTILGGIGRLRHPHNREIFLAALSAIVNRVSLQARDSQPGRKRELQIGTRRTAALFFEASERLLEALAVFSRQAKGGGLRIWQTDARELTGIPANAVDRIITSPPYGGTYDYAEMHALRNVWLGLDWGPFEKLEIGSRRRPQGIAAFEDDIAAVFAAMARVSKKGALCYWVIADGVIGKKAYRADQLSIRAAEKAGWRFEKTGEVERPIWSELERKAYGDEPKREYLMEFRLAF